MLARYYDPTLDVVVERKLIDNDELVTTFQAVRQLSSERGVPAVELRRGDGSSLVVATTPTGGVLMWSDSLGATFHTVGDRAAEGVAIFDYLGHYSEVEQALVIPTADIDRAASSYFKTGSPMTESLNLEPD